MEGLLVSVAGAAEFAFITKEPGVGRWAGAGTDGDADADTDTGAGLAAVSLGLGEGCACETAGDFFSLAGAGAGAGAGFTAMDELDVEVTRGPRVLRDAEVLGSFWAKVLPMVLSSMKEPRLGGSGCFDDAWVWLGTRGGVLGRASDTSCVMTGVLFLCALGAGRGGCDDATEGLCCAAC